MATKFSSYPGRESPAISHHTSQHGVNQTGARTLQEIEAEMLAAAQQSRSAAQRQQQQQALLQQEEENLRYQRQQQERQQQERHFMSQQQLLAQYEREQQHQVNSQRFLLQKEQERLQLREQERLQRTPPPRMLPGVSQSPRFHEHQRQILLLQQQQEQQQQQRLLELQEQLRYEEMERQMLTQLRLQQSHSPNNFGHRRQPSGPTIAELQAAHVQQQHQHQHQQRRQRSQSPAVGHSHFPAPLQETAPYLPQNVQLQQRLLSEMAQAEFIRDMQGATSQAEQEALRAEAMRKIVEAEKMEERRRKKAAKIAHMVRDPDTIFYTGTLESKIML